MMGVEFWITIGILVLLTVLVWRARKKIEVQKIIFPFLYFILYRSKWGLAWMDRIGPKYSRFWSFLFGLGVIIGFVAMVWICVELISSTLTLIFEPEAAPGIMPVLPIEVKAIKVVTVPFLYWIISIFVIALVHEFSHGIATRHIGVKVKSSGLAALCLLIPIIPAAFVEPDEKRILKMSTWKQMKVYAAGPLANILTALVVLILVAFVFTPILKPLMGESGVEISRLESEAPAEIAGLQKGDVIEKINGVSIVAVSNFSSLMDGTSPDDIIHLTTSRGEFNVTLSKSPMNASHGYLGVYPKQIFEAKGWLPQSAIPVIQWVLGLFTWLFILNVGIGVFNLLPVGPLDGGRMMHALCTKYKTIKIYKFVSMFFFLLILVNIFAGFFK